jgi:LacI family transcriptional regulator
MLLEPTRLSLKYLKRRQPDGLIAHLASEEMLSALESLQARYVNVSSYLPPGRDPRVSLNDYAIGAAAAEHLIQRGFRRFGFVRIIDAYFSKQRHRGYADTIREAGLELLPEPPLLLRRFQPDREKVDDLLSRFRQWVDHSKVPLGLFACTDEMAVRYVNACNQAGIHIPEEIAIVGVDDDEFLCESTTPPLSSVSIQADRVGMEAARTLDDLLAGQPAPAEPCLIMPGQVRTRQSSDVLAIEDDQVVTAMRHIRQNAHLPIKIKDVLNCVPLSRRMLEIRFKQHTGQTILQAIRTQHLQRAKSLLAETDLTITEVAQKSGFANSQRLNDAFRRTMQMSPKDYRSRYSSQL